MHDQGETGEEISPFGQVCDFDCFAWKRERYPISIAVIGNLGRIWRCVLRRTDSLLMRCVAVEQTRQRECLQMCNL